MKSYKNKWTLLVPVLCCLAFTLNGCGSDDDEDDGGGVTPTEEVVEFENITLSGAEEAPAVTTSATGTLNASFNKKTKVLSYTITYSGITPTMMHFHKGAPGVSGGVAVGIGPQTDPYSGSSGFSSPLQGQTPALSAAEEADLLAGNWYLNIHSAQYPAGEIRGQLD